MELALWAVGGIALLTVIAIYLRQLVRIAIYASAVYLWFRYLSARRPMPADEVIISAAITFGITWLIDAAAMRLIDSVSRPRAERAASPSESAPSPAPPVVVKPAWIDCPRCEGGRRIRCLAAPQYCKEGYVPSPFSGGMHLRCEHCQYGTIECPRCKGTGRVPNN